MKSFGDRSKIIESFDQRYVCYHPDDHAILSSAIAEGNKCIQLTREPVIESWYRSKWIWFGVGLVVGGSVGFGVSR